MTADERRTLRRMIDARRRVLVGAVVNFAAMEHGRESTYTRGCRCDDCLRASRLARHLRGYPS